MFSVQINMNADQAREAFLKDSPRYAAYCISTSKHLFATNGSRDDNGNHV